MSLSFYVELFVLPSMHALKQTLLLLLLLYIKPENHTFSTKSFTNCTTNGTLSIDSQFR